MNEMLNKRFIVENVSFETVLMMFDEISSHPVDLLDFKKENGLYNSLSAISFIPKSRSSHVKVF